MKRILKISILVLATIVLLIMFASQRLKLTNPPDITDLEITTIKGNELPLELNQRPENNNYVQYDKRCLEVMTLFNGDMNPAIDVVHWSGMNSPTIIYHHGGSVVPNDEKFQNI